jgi:hypothetical protein
MRDGCRHWATVRKWPAEFESYAPGYKPRLGECRVSTWPFSGSKPLPSTEPIQDERAEVGSKKDPTVAKWKCRSVSVVRDFPPILGRFNPYLCAEKRWKLHTHLTQIAYEYS